MDHQGDPVLAAVCTTEAGAGEMGVVEWLVLVMPINADAFGKPLCDPTGLVHFRCLLQLCFTYYICFLNLS